MLGINSIDEYIRCGGTLRARELGFDDEDVNAEDAPFRDDESTRRYIDTAICKNIQHSLSCCETGGRFRHLQSLYEAEELTSAINRVIENMNHEFLVRVLTDDFKAHDLGSSAQILRESRDESRRTDIPDRADRKAVTKRLMEEIVLLETVKAVDKKQRVFKLQFSKGEFDMVVYNTEANTFDAHEIKHSKEIVPEQYRVLMDAERCGAAERRFGKLSKRIVIYRGAAFTESNGVKYRNAEEYLSDIH